MPEQTPPWKQNAPSILVVYSILAAIAGAVLIFVMAEKDEFTEGRWVFPVSTLLFSAFLFIYSAEQITDALDESNLDKLLYCYSLYNLAVVFLFAGIFSTIYFRYIVQCKMTCDQQWLLKLFFVGL